MFKRPKKTLNEVFDPIFKSQITLLEKLGEETTLQIEVINNLNHNIVENYRILLQMEIKEAIRHNPNDSENILKLYSDYIGIAKKPNVALDDTVNKWKKTKGIKNE